MKNGDDNEALAALIRDVLQDKRTLINLLDHYCRDDRRTVDDSSIDIETDGSVIHEDLTGYLMIFFQEDAYYGCKDKDRNDEHDCEVGFKLDAVGQQIIFSTPQSSRPSYYHENE